MRSITWPRTSTSGTPTTRARSTRVPGINRQDLQFDACGTPSRVPMHRSDPHPAIAITRPATGDIRGRARRPTGALRPPARLVGFRDRSQGRRHR
jgi:hypothetical protein